MSALTRPSQPAPKQIRFVNNQGEPPSKRRRITAARKTRCAGERPTCSTCAKNGHVCLGYSDIDKKKDHDDVRPTVARPSSSVVSRPGSDEAASHVKASYTDDSDDGDDGDDDGGDDDTSGRPRKTSRQDSSHAQSRLDSSDQCMSDFRRPGSLSSTTQLFPPCLKQELQQLSQQHLPHRNESHRVPYFRYFGPTAIVPGYKQMVVDVSVRDRRLSRGSSFSALSPNAGLLHHQLPKRHVGRHAGHHAGHHARAANGFEPVFETLEDLPVYDPGDANPVHPLIISLIRTFFVHLGCNYPFLRKDRVLRMVRHKRLETILVDAMCALAARFSELTIFTDDPARLSRPEYGHVFAQRAKAATVDTFPCPTVAAVQACLLMAYEGFGADQDSALWMYLGLAIRMAVDLGLEKKVGISAHGDQDKDPWFVRTWTGAGTDARKDGLDGRRGSSVLAADDDVSDGPHHDKVVSDSGHDDADDARETEQERADTFWAVFFLDRVISSGTGRPVTFRDDDFELALPEPTLTPATDWPAPFPSLAQIIHLYGRVSDVLNNIRHVDDLTHEKMQRLRHMENDLTELHRRQDPRLNFNASNFQAYVRAGQGTTFILLHFWFHALIIILHQPTLLAPFGRLRRTHQLLSNSHELSMSSAKTIADILAFAELIDPKSFIGNPFTSQPMYIAACAFLMESAANASPPASRETTPTRVGAEVGAEAGREALVSGSSTGTGAGAGAGAGAIAGAGTVAGTAAGGTTSKHSLLASNANQNYQRCYKSLQQLHMYWGGVRYILTALDQKAKGIWDCETFTSEQLEGTAPLPLPRAPLRRKDGQDGPDGPDRQESRRPMPRFDHPASPNAPPIAWSLTGTSHSANPSLTLLYQTHPGTPANTSYGQAGPAGQDSDVREPKQPRPLEPYQPYAKQATSHVPSPQPPLAATPPGNMIYDPIRQSLPEVSTMYHPVYPRANVSAVRYSNCMQPQQHQHSVATTPGPSHHAYQLSQGDMDTAALRSGPDSVHAMSASRQTHASGAHPHQQPHHGGYAAMIPRHSEPRQASSPQRPQQTPPSASVASYATSPSRPPYEGAVLASASPPGNGVAADFGSGPVASGDSGNTQASASASVPTPGTGHLNGPGMYTPAYFGGGLMGGPYQYLETGPITEVITFDSHEIDISSLGLPADMMPPQWLEYLPRNVVNLFDDGMNSAHP